MEAAYAYSTPDSELGGLSGLDPYENISRLSEIPASEDFQPGKYLRQYVDFYRSHAFGRQTSYCGAGTLVRVSEVGLELRPQLCDTWSCLGCSVRKASWFREQLGLAVEHYGLDSFATLTLERYSRNAAASYRGIALAWNRYHEREVRRHGKYSYVWVREPTAAGIAHVHVVWNSTIEGPELAAAWLRATGDSYVVDIQPIGSAAAVNYMTKYCASQSKARPVDELTGSTKLRVYSKSHDVRFRPMRGNGGAGFERLPIGYREAEVLAKRHGVIQSSKDFGAPRLTVDVPVEESGGILRARLGGFYVYGGRDE